MDRTVQQLIAIILVAVVAGVAAYGSYLPMRKAQLFIATLQSFQIQPPTSLQELENRLAMPLDYPSPIGQEELVRNTGNSVLSFVQRSSDATTTAALIGFLQSYFDPILARGKGMSFGQDIYIEGAINEVAFSRTGGINYLENAKKYYLEANAMGPNRPQPLYGLFDIYRAEGDVTDTVMVANKILANWPSDTSVRQSLATFLKTMAATSSSSPKK